MKYFSLAILVAFICGACAKGDERIYPIIPPSLNVKTTLSKDKLSLSVSWNDLKQLYRDAQYTIIVQPHTAANDTIRRNYKLTQLDNIPVVPNTTIAGTIIGYNDQGDTFIEEFNLPIGPAPAPDARYISLADATFEQFLIDAHIDSDRSRNGLLLKQDALKVDSLFISVGSGNISSIGVTPNNIKGIEYFQNLTYLSVITAFMDSLDVSQNEKLTYLDCRGIDFWDYYKAGLKYLNLGKKPLMETMRCGTSEIKMLDVRKCSSLTTLSCRNSLLNSLQLQDCSLIEYLDVSGNDLNQLDLSTNTRLRFLDCSSARSTQGLVSLDLQANRDLVELYCMSQSITTSLSLCTNSKLRICRTDYTPISTILVPYPIDGSQLAIWSKDKRTTYQVCN